MPELVIHDGHKCAYLDDRKIMLTKLEYRTLLCLGIANGNVVGRDELVAAAYPYAQGGVSDESISQNISHLRRKLGNSAHSYIITRHGMGYYLQNARVIYADEAEPSTKENLVATHAIPVGGLKAQPTAPLVAFTPPSARLRLFLLQKGLTRREREIITLLTNEIKAGLSNSELAEQLMIATDTLKRHLQNIYRKLGVHRRSQAIQVALQAMYGGGGVA